MTINYNGIDVLKKQPTKEDPFAVDDYPYGFRLRTTIRYWVDTTNYGQRFAAQTLNPKTKAWNAPKYSTYSKIVLIGLDSIKHITWLSIDDAYTTLKETQPKIDALNSIFSEYQKITAQGILSILKVYEKVTFTVSEGCKTEEEQKKHDEEQKQTNILINKAIVCEMVKSGLKVDEAIKELKK